MSVFLGKEAETDIKIQKVIRKSIDRGSKQSMIQDIKRASIAEQPKNSSFRTVLNIAISMVGSSTLVFPILFMKAGILSSMIISFIIGGISCKTTQVLVVHNQTDEMDLPDTILRILGHRWMQMFNISNVILLWASGIIFMILICKQLYPIVILVADQLNINVAPQDDITFNMFSYQWLGVIFIVLIFPLLAQKKLQTVLKLIPYGTISIGVFLIFTIFMGCNNLINNYDQIIHNIKWFSFDFQTIAGTCGMAFMSQCMIIPISKNNANPQNNGRDIALGFLWTWTIYSLGGVFGTFAIAGRELREGTTGNILLDYYPNGNVAVIVIQILLFMQLAVVFPVFQFITRSQFLGLFYDLDRYPKWAFYAFTATYAGTCLLIQCLQVDVSLIISLCGAMVGLFQEYLLPVAVHLTCLYRSDKQVYLAQNIQSTNNTQSDYLIDNTADLDKFGCCNDHSELKNNLSRLQRTSIYGIMMLVGLAVVVGMVMQFLQI